MRMGLYIDVETTGLDPARAAIVEVGASVMGPDGVETDSFVRLCNPGPEALARSDPEAFRVHQIDIDDIRCAQPIRHVAQEFRDWAEPYRAGADPADWYSFNTGFEDSFLKLPPWMLAIKWADCLQKLSTQVLGSAGALPLRPDGQFKLSSLAEAAAFFDVRQKERHRALADARTSGKIHWRIRERRPAPAT